MSEPEITRTLTVETWPLSFWSDDKEPRVLDLDLADRLGYSRPRDIRKLVERMIEKRQLTDVRATVSRSSIPNGGFRDDSAYHLTETQALKVAAKSETEPADKLLDEIIRVFLLAKQGKLPGQSNPQSVAGIFEAHKPAVLAAMAKRAEEGNVEAASIYMKLARVSHHKKPTSPAPSVPKEHPKKEMIRAIDRETPGLSYREIARRVGVDKSLVSRTLQRKKAN
jgi:Winged helix-turn-helix DNA-binding